MKAASRPQTMAKPDFIARERESLQTSAACPIKKGSPPSSVVLSKIHTPLTAASLRKATLLDCLPVLPLRNRLDYIRARSRGALVVSFIEAAESP
ncbi:hypothetical protein CDAR_286421 [Caerostris darwini]|uniref:Uncharacterized protein n=1 Tax=Caerostris darwini TaxID=1538125 RepID=A0AAV4W112_9ARAC|nr:hypothetical protein CDAR_286421 [Caerostris darwini]